MGLSIADQADVDLQGDVAEKVLNLIDDGYLAGGRIDENSTVYLDDELFALQMSYQDSEDANGYVIEGVLRDTEGHDVTSEYIGGVVDVICGKLRYMGVEIKTQEGKPGVTLVFSRHGQ